MKSLTDIITEKSREEMIISENAVALDSLFYKWNQYTSSLKNPLLINESMESSKDIMLTESESKAATDILTYVCEQLIASYENELKQIQVDEGFKDFVDKAKEKISDKYQQVADKIKGLKELIKELKSKAIKSIKDMAQKFQVFMMNVGMALSDIVKKLGGDPEAEGTSFIEMTVKASDAELEEIKKNNVYESLANYLSTGEPLVNESMIYEFLGFGKKKKKEDEESSNEYDKSKKGTDEQKVTWKTTLLAAFKQMALYWLLTFVIPLILTCIPGIGPGLGALVGTIAKLAWSVTGICKQFKMYIKLVKSDQWKHEMPKKTKIIRTLVFVVSIVAAGWAAKTAGSDLINHAMTIMKNGITAGLKLIAPDKLVAAAAKGLDNLIKACGGNGFPGWENIEKARDEAIKFVEDTISKTVDKYGGASPEALDQLEKNLQGMGKYGKAAWDQLKANFAENPNFIPQGIAIIDGSIQGGGYQGTGKAYLDALNDKGLKEGVDYTLKQVNLGKKGCFVEVIFKNPGKVAAEATKAYSDAHNGFAIAYNIGKVSDVVTSSILVGEPITMTMTHVVPFAGFMPIIKNRAGYLLRVGSNGTQNNDIYKIEKYEEYTYIDLEKKYGEKNKTVFSKMTAILKKNKSALEEAKESAEDDKMKKVYEKALEKFEDGVKNNKCLVLLGTLYKKSKKKDVKEGLERMSLADYIVENKESYLKNYIHEAEEDSADTNETDTNADTNNDNKDGIVPVIFINPLLMACGDLVPQRSVKKEGSKEKGPRSNPYYLKGILSSIELLPIEGGSKIKDIIDMFVKIFQESIKSNLNMVADVPCYKEKRKYVENEKSKYKGKNREDFGMLKNSEITEIINDKNEASKYIGGEYKTNRNATLEKTDKNEEETKERFKKYMTSNDEVKKYLEDHPKLKKLFINDEGEVDDDALNISYDVISRSESAYISGKTKKGLFQRIKDLFRRKNKDENEEDEKAKEIQKKLKRIDPDELSNLSKLLSKARKKEGKKKKISESLIHPLYIGMYEDTYNEDMQKDLFFECNMQMMLEEFNEWIENEEMFDKEEPLIDE